MSRGAMSSGGGRSSLGYLFEPEETTLYHTAAKPNKEIEKATDTNTIGVKDDGKMIGAEPDQEPPQLPPPKREVSNPILSSNVPPCNIYRTSQSSCNSGLLITPAPGLRSPPRHTGPCPSITFRSTSHPIPSHPRKVHSRTRSGEPERHTERHPSRSSHGRRSLRRRDGQLRRQEPRRACRRGAPQGGAAPRRARPAVLAALHQQGCPAPPRARDRHLLRAAGHGGGAPAAAGRRHTRPRAGARDGAGGGGQGRGGAAHRREEGKEEVRAADVSGGCRDVQPRGHVHGRRRRVLPLQLANGGRRGAGDRDVRHIRALRRSRGRDGVLGAVGAPGAVARVAVAHARVAPPAAGGPLRAQRRVRHRQRRAGHRPPRLRLLQSRLRPRPLLRRGPRDYAVRHGLHVRPRRPGPPPLPGRPHRQRALLPASRCRPQDPPHGQV